jgi:hypothetical protein
LGLEPPEGGAHERNASDHLREHTGVDPAGDPVWASFSESLNWIDVHRKPLPLANLIEAAQKAGVAVFFYDNDAGRDRTSSAALGRRNLVAGQEFMRSAREAHSGTALLVGRDHLDPQHCGGAEMTMQHACKVHAERVHDLS